MGEPQSRGSRAQRLITLLSAVVLSVVYGFFAARNDTFPAPLLERAVEQAQLYLTPPSFVSSKVYDRHGVRDPMPGRRSDEPVLLATWWPERDWSPALKLIDRDGTPLHAWPVSLPDTLPRTVGSVGRSLEQQPVIGAHLFQNGDVLFNLLYVATVRLDACGDLVWWLPTGGHHMVERAEDGTIWTSGVLPEPARTTPGHPDGLPGIEEPVYQDQIYRVSPDGRIVESMNVLDLLYDNDLQHFVFRRSFIEPDLLHVNDVEPLPESLAAAFPLFESGDLLVSIRNLSLVFVVDPESRAVRWHAALPFVQQHDPDFLADGWIGVFDNRRDGTVRGEALGGSRIVALQPHTDSSKVIYPTGRSEPFHTNLVGMWQELEGGNLLLAESRAGRVVEVDSAGSTLWEWVHEPYDDTLVATLTTATVPGVTASQVESWPCGADASER